MRDFWVNQPFKISFMIDGDCLHKLRQIYSSHTLCSSFCSVSAPLNNVFIMTECRESSMTPVTPDDENNTICSRIPIHTAQHYLIQLLKCSDERRMQTNMHDIKRLRDMLKNEEKRSVQNST